MKLSICFPKWLNHFTLPTAQDEGSSSPSHQYFMWLLFLISDILVGLSSLLCYFHFLDECDVEHNFRCSQAICTSSVGEVSLKSFACLFLSLFVLLYSKSSFHVIDVFQHTYALQLFFPVCDSSFHFSEQCLLNSKAFSF